MTDSFSHYFQHFIANHALLEGEFFSCPLVEALRWIALLMTAIWLLKLGVHTLLFRRMLRQGSCYDKQRDGELFRLYHGLCQKVGLQRVPPLYKSPNPRFPAFTMGITRPVIFLHPELAAQLDDEERACALTHELVHVKRRDNPRIWLLELSVAFFPLAVIQIVPMNLTCDPGEMFLFVAGVFAASALLRTGLIALFRTMREHSCDDQTVSVTGTPLSLAASLIKTWRFIHAAGNGRNDRLSWSYVLLTGGPKVETRVKRLLSYQRPRIRPLLSGLLKITAFSVAVTYGVFLWQYHVNQAYRPMLEACVAAGHHEGDDNNQCTANCGMENPDAASQ